MKTELNSRRRLLKSALVGSVVLLASACDSLPKLPQANATTNTDGSELAKKVYQALKTSPFTNLLNLRVESSGETEVIVRGLVPNKSDINNVDLVANQVEGVSHAIIMVQHEE